MNSTENGVEQLRSIMKRLRDPSTGCAWDVKQTFETIAPFTIEEAYEVADAIERKDLVDLKDELGDLLFQVIFHSQMADEMGVFNFDDVAESIVEKMIRRHPHVFGNKTYSSEEELKAAWEAIKSQERSEKDSRSRGEDKLPDSALDGVARNLPALKQADKIQKRAARVGFDWTELASVWEKLEEEISEVKQAIDSQSQEAIEDEIGDLFFTAVNLARHCSVDSEQAMRRATAKFETRFRQVEQLASSRGQKLNSMSLTELDALWEDAKLKS